jgi:two-component system LytT family response regulator
VPASAAPGPAAPGSGAAAIDDDEPLPAAPGPPSAAAIANAARPAGQFVERILVREGSSVHVIPIDALDLLEAQDDYVSVRSGGRSWLKAQPLGDLAAGLDPARFVRIHRSYVVNVERIAKLELYAKDSRVAILKDGTQLPVSRSGYARLREMM